MKVYAPWCGHCKALAPTWTELEKLYEKNDKIIIGSLNAEENEMIARSIGVKGFPTILVFFVKDLYCSFIQKKIKTSQFIMKDQEQLKRSLNTLMKMQDFQLHMISN